MDFPALPSFYTDEMFTKGQKDLYGLGTDFIAGRIPEYYRSIGEAGGPEFENMLRLNTEDITRAGFESAARMGTRGGATQSNILKAVRSMSAPLRWADLMRSFQGKQGFLDTGVNALTGVRNAGLSFGGQKNQFNLGIAGMEQNQAKYMMEQEMAEKASKDAMWSNIISGALGAAGTIGGAMIAGPPGAAAGATLGSAAGKSLSGGSGGAYDFAMGGSGGGYDDLDFYSGRMKSLYGLA